MDCNDIINIIKINVDGIAYDDNGGKDMPHKVGGGGILRGFYYYWGCEDGVAPLSIGFGCWI